MDKYEKLKSQILRETKWCIQNIDENHGGIGLPENLSFSDFIGNNDYPMDEYERGMLFAYLSLKSEIEAIEKQ